MAPKQKIIVIGIVIAITILACQSNVNPISSPTAEPTKPAIKIPTYGPGGEIATSQALLSNGPNEGNTAPALPPGFMENNNIVCVVHRADDALSCLNKDGWQIYNSNIPALIAHCPDGRTYLSIENRLYLYRNQTFVGAIAPDLLRITSVQPFACGRGDEFWGWTLDGLYIQHFDGTKWRDYLAQEVLGSFPIGFSKAMTVAPNGDLWVTADNNLVKFDGTQWQVFRKGKGLEEDMHPSGLVLDANGNGWALGGGYEPQYLNSYNLLNRAKERKPAKLLKYDGQQWTILPAPDGFYADSIKLDHTNRIWVIGTGKTVETTPSVLDRLFYIFDPQINSWTLKDKEQRFSKRMIRDMQFDGQDRLWVATDYGLDVYDGTTWITYRMDNADLYANSADKIVILGDIAQLPAPLSKAPGSVSGKFVDPSSTKSYAGLQVELCLGPESAVLPGSTPCANEIYHVLTTMDADGNFLFADIPPGRYYLAIQRSSDQWGIMIDSSSPNGDGLEFEVNPEAETNLGEIKRTPEEK